MSIKKNHTKKSNKSAPSLARTPRSFHYGSLKIGPKMFKALLAAAAIAVGILAIMAIRTSVDLAHLGWASHRLDYVQSQLKTTTDIDIKVSRSKACYYNEQMNDFDKGKLFCGVIMSAKYTAHNGEQLRHSQAAIRDLLSRQDVFGLPATSNASDVSVSFPRPGQSVACSLNFYDAATDAINSTVPVSTEFNIICETGVSRQYYPINDSPGFN